MPITFYTKPGCDELTKWKRSKQKESPEIVIGDPMTIEFRRVHICSKNFDYFGKSKVMLTTFTKSKHVKEASLAVINYYDDDVKPERCGNGFAKFTIGPFDASEYGDPVVFHTPAYLGNTVTITTKFWEIDDPSVVKQSLGLVEYGLGLITPLVTAANPMSKPYFTMAHAGLGLSSRVICGAIKHDQLAMEHTIEFRLDSSKPLLPGKYVCLPDVTDLNTKYDIIRRFTLVENRLVEKVMDAEEGIYRYNEYNGTYFVLKVTNKEREDLVDFDFTASAGELMTMFHEGTQDYRSVLLEKTKTTYEYGRLQEFLEEIATDATKARALAKHLPPKIQNLVEPLIPVSPKIN